MNQTSIKGETPVGEPRELKPPPYVPVRYLRIAAKLTIDETIARIRDETGHSFTRGAISAVENGHRGASAELLRALEIAYDLPPGVIDTTYRPRAHRSNGDGAHLCGGANVA
ncbi:helix-turn-helix transcriptional regulator [Rhodococcus erythropolis]|uniref:helix-turn-helix domain-containing protein n=1 Tax=Rhodococcus erythropolis TaxID=1833 RepID=UPI0029490DDC|nr:helix-turn-helix transcriptional regulator [Rhodococcus erythropolis]MDV6275408.1 helix-turn-helix transcriptional regulator [Rhodococcus erythropolis]